MIIQLWTGGVPASKEDLTVRSSTRLAGSEKNNASDEEDRSFNGDELGAKPMVDLPQESGSSYSRSTPTLVKSEILYKARIG